MTTMFSRKTSSIMPSGRDNSRKEVIVSSSDGFDLETASIRSIPYEQVVLPKDRDVFIHLVMSYADDKVMERMQRYKATLPDLGLDVSTGRVVDFPRVHLRPQPEEGTAPLVYPCHFQDSFVNWPAPSGKKANAIAFSPDTQDLLVASGLMCLSNGSRRRRNGGVSWRLYTNPRG